ncbi:hypothetical protein E2C01_071652 [Portunus trituberculatus]|uniref:Uncharacterized protein n=1 Tax=Portunus trituberculatus TaxID=210409 RepID=A0A5B7I8T9_PORTR|nr:hypothetical protein [Portunus trituberculatus]
MRDTGTGQWFRSGRGRGRCAWDAGVGAMGVGAAGVVLVSLRRRRVLTPPKVFQRVVLVSTVYFLYRLYCLCHRGHNTQ